MKKAATTPTDIEPRVVSIPTAAHMLGLGRSSIWELIASGALKSIRIGRRRLVLVEEIDAFIAKLTGKAA